MSNRLFPLPADNTYHGPKLALWVFGLVVLMKAGISLGSIFNGRTAASSADGIPLDSFTPGGAQTVLSLFALLGLANLIICVVCIVVLVRYRTLIPIMFVLLVLQHLGRYLILHFLPVPRTGAPPGTVINLVLLGGMIIGLALSLRSRRNGGTGRAVSTGAT